MSSGIPVIALDRGGYRDTIIDGQTGYLIPRDAKALANKINLLLNKPKKALQMGTRGRSEVVDKWRWEDLIGNLGGYISS
jgi:glycosyltransferase involved in cell wall biosynthesis